MVYVSRNALRLSVYFALLLSKDGFIIQMKSIIQQPKVNLELDHVKDKNVERSSGAAIGFQFQIEWNRMLEPYRSSS